ncbi:hypothetical protein DXG03_006877 [Asterophora parasitica]|uniref:PWWP domain-containing protein n=1 Tax=Asterophora parasitica TaxID=117018 RepID=A0A9P7G4X5_9AGAR|nr:hypothetical protein DXG03_006877 [Asterophora parasitica]
MSKKSTKAAPKEVSSYAERDIVLGKVRGFPPWPGMVSFLGRLEPLGCGKVGRRSTNDFFVGIVAWLVAKDISKLKQHEIESYINEPFKKSGDLLAGYNVALNPTAWEASRASALASIAQNGDDEGESAEAEGDEVDELESDAEGGGKKKKAAPSKKRKRESDVKARKPAKEKKEKEPKEKKERKTPAKSRKSASGAKSKAMVESEDEQGGDEDAEGEDAAKLNEDPEANKVRDWRHRLQKAFLSNKATPDDADMPNLDALFTTVESYDSMTVAHLQFSKIGKVMRHITLLKPDRLPRDAEFRFRDRAQALVERWQTQLGTREPKDGVKDEEPKEEAKPNGSAVVADAGAVEGAAKPVVKKDEERSVTEGAAALDLNGTGAADADADGDADITAPTTDADAPGEVDGQAEAEADAPGEVDAPADADTSVPGDITMSEA